MEIALPSSRVPIIVGPFFRKSARNPPCWTKEIHSMDPDRITLPGYSYK